MSLLHNRVTSKIKSIFQSFQFRTKLPFEKDWSVNVIDKRVTSQAKQQIWWDDELLANSLFNYGVVEEVKPLLNLPVGLSPTYTDLLVYCIEMVQKLYPNRVEYLELGVSVGKNFLTVAQSLSNANLTGFEIEEINPFLEQYFTFVSKTSWVTKSDSIKKAESSIREYTIGSNAVSYLSGDIWDEYSWKQLASRKFNVIFSDAFHSKNALLHEYKIISDLDLLADQFVMVWDDLHFDMKDGFLEINRHIKRSRKYGETNCYLIQINGWLGENWSTHPVGIITNIF